MTKKHSKLGNAAHVKRHTEGTSNELSFSVLDAKKNEADVTEGTDDKVQSPRFGGTPVFSWRPGKQRSKATPTAEKSLPLSEGSSETQKPTTALNATPGVYNPSAAAVSFASSKDEIERRKSRRRKKRAFAIVAGLILGILAVGGASYVLINEFTNHQTQVGVLEQSFEKINEADETVLAIDQILSEPLENRDSATMEKLLLQIPDASTRLNEGGDLAQTALENMRQTSEKSIAEQSLAAIDARKSMLTSGQTLLEASIQVQSDKKTMQQAWDSIINADEAAREAAALVTVTTPENVTNSREKSVQAQSLFSDAAALLEQLSASPLRIETQALQSYVAKRLEACEASIASDDAILAQNRQEAQDQNAVYNSADTEASSLARELPEDPAVLVDQAYARSVKDAETEYSQMRLSAGTADAFIRDYLGALGK